MSPSDQEVVHPTPDLFRPTLGRALLTLVIATASFFIPQEIPLEYYPLNNPSSGLQYLEITCAANYTGTTEIFLDTGRGYNELDKISWPIGPSDMAFTYTFPLADTPLYRLRVDPTISGSGEFVITNFRLINRRNEEIRRFDQDSFTNLHDIAAIKSRPDGWTIVMTNSNDPTLEIPLGGTLIAEGMNERNLKRSLLSSSYLTMMLWIILLAVFFAFRGPEPMAMTLRSIMFLLFMAFCFSIVGNRGLIKNSMRYARTHASPLTKELRLEIEFEAARPGMAQLYWDTGDGMSEQSSVRRPFEGREGTQFLRFPLPIKPVQALRFDPSEGEVKMAVTGIRIVDTGHQPLAVLPLDSLQAQHSIGHLAIEAGKLTIEVLPGAEDPMLGISPAQIPTINEARTKTAPH